MYTVFFRQLSKGTTISGFIINKKKTKHETNKCNILEVHSAENMSIISIFSYSITNERALNSL